MCEKRKAVLYPFDREAAPILRHKELLDGFDITAVVSPKGWAFCGKDAGTADGGHELGIMAESDFDRALEDCGTLIICDTADKADFRKLIYPKLKKAVEKGRDIVCTMRLEEALLSETAELCRTRGVDFRYMGGAAKLMNYSEFQELPEILERINTPVIFVMGISQKTNKFEIQLSLRENLLRQGYRVSQIGSRGSCELLGFHSFPQFMYSSELSEGKKVCMFNRFVKTIELREKPDVIVIGVPGGIMTFNEQFTNGFGITAYEVSQAVKPDAAILSILYEDYNPEFYQEILLRMKYRFGFEIDCFNMACTKFDWILSKSLLKELYVTIQSEMVSTKLRELGNTGVPIFNVMSPGGAEAITEAIVDALAGSEQYEAI